MERMEIGSAEWTRLKETIVSEFIPGQLIKHEWLYGQRFGWKISAERSSGIMKNRPI